MSLRDLKKSTQLNNEEVHPVDIESFIDGAQSYAYGIGEKTPPQETAGRTKNATFSLTQQSASELANISKRTGICKSRLLRLLVHDQHYSDDQWLFTQGLK